MPDVDTVPMHSERLSAAPKIRGGKKGSEGRRVVLAGAPHLAPRTPAGA
jgi:hypothetical protein